MKAALYFADDQIKHDFFMLQSGRIEEKEIFVTIQITIFFHWLNEPGSLKYASKPADRYTRRDLYYIT